MFNRKPDNVCKTMKQHNLEPVTPANIFVGEPQSEISHDAVTLSRKQKRFKIVAFSYTLTVIYKCSTGNQIMFARQ